tara:strand:- start:1370 stop:1843 length:474 start_codon:yes stop_codon:yes gene_type:complete
MDKFHKGWLIVGVAFSIGAVINLVNNPLDSNPRFVFGVLVACGAFTLAKRKGEERHPIEINVEGRVLSYGNRQDVLVDVYPKYFKIKSKDGSPIEGRSIYVLSWKEIGFVGTPYVQMNVGFHRDKNFELILENHSWVSALAKRNNMEVKRAPRLRDM